MLQPVSLQKPCKSEDGRFVTEYERQVLLSRNTSCQVIYKIYFRDFKLASLGSELYNSKTEENEHI